MPKPVWTPDPEQRRLLAAIVRAAKKRDDAEADYRAKLADGVDREIPIHHLAEALGIERKTVYRHLGRRMA